MSISSLEGATFESFVEGPSNSAAAVAARSVASQPGGGRQSLLLLGPAGVGKTHLLGAIAATLRTTQPGLEVCQETAASLLDRARGLHGGLAPLHEAGLVLFDELERISEHRDLEGAVLDFLLARAPMGRPVVLASAQSLETLGSAGAELAALLSEGTTVHLAPPDSGTRLAILRLRSAEFKPGLPDDVLAAVARLPITSVRELLAAIQRLVAFQSVSPGPLDPAQARLLVTGRATARTDDDEPPVPAPASRQVELRPLELADDEFGSFLTEVVASVSHQVDRWRAQVGEAILRHGGEGFLTRRLEALLEAEMPARPGEVLDRFELDVMRLRALESTAASLAPELAGSPAFRDPDRIDDAETALALARLRHDPLPAPSPEFSLERFGEGPGNRRALQAVRGVLHQPGARDNPLVVVGASGTGKTHLLHAIGNQLGTGAGPVACLAAATFAGDVRRLLESGGLANWRSRFRHAGAFLLDDLHLLAGRPEAQEEFLVLFAHLLAHGRQVVVAMNAPPSSLKDIDPRLLSRLEAGLVVELPRPDREIRLLVVKQLLAASPAAGDAALADWLANRPADSVRAVQGAVRRVLSAAEAEGIGPSPALAREVLDRIEPATRPASAGGTAAGGAPVPVRTGQGPEKMVTVWPRIGDRLIEELD
ncbi:MAG: DnaA/Hda family protein [Gemmatimonadota bacterium]|mgnify:CR=1 FL=1|nr:DnaA/Hda family protein [Gemmatimonadota bacterium]